MGGNISETAVAVASLRALSCYEKDSRFNCNDSYAEMFLPDDKKVSLKDEKIRSMIRKAVPKGLYEYVISRTKYFDSVFTEACNDGFKQIVLTGAGFDSRAHRLALRSDEISVFEVDLASTQEFKKTVLSREHLPVCPVKYISQDLETEGFFEKLEQHGYVSGARTLFMLEGVSFYMSDASIRTILEGIRQNSISGSVVCMDFQTIENSGDLIDVKLKDEKIRFGIKSNDIVRFASDNGYSIREHLDSREIEKRFMLKSDGTLFGEISPLMNFILMEH